MTSRLRHPSPPNGGRAPRCVSPQLFNDIAEKQTRDAEAGNAWTGRDHQREVQLLRTLANRQNGLPNAATKRNAKWGLAIPFVFVVATMVWWAPRSADKSAWVARDENGAQWASGQTISSARTTRSITFGDGSNLHMQPDTFITLDTITPQGAEIRLEAGYLKVSIPHKRNTRWRFTAGNVVVHVVGTRFNLSLVEGQVAVTMQAGAVTVTTLQGKAIAQLGKGQSFHWDLKAHAAVGQQALPTGGPVPATTPPASDTTGGAAIALPLAQTDASSSAPGDTPVPTTRVPAASHDAQGWLGDSRAGRHASAMKQAHAYGIAKLVRQLGADQLLQLADSARLSGDAAAAILLLEGLRNRFARAPQSGEGTFLLARLVHEAGQTRRALALYQEFCARTQSGVLLAPALGRVIELATALGQNKTAQQAAHRYLQVDPQGPFHAKAQEVVSTSLPAL